MKQYKNICILGASFDTGNLGVSALAESSIKCIINARPDASITLLGSGKQEQTYTINILKKRLILHTVPIRFSKNIFLPNHYFIFFLNGIIKRIIPFLPVFKKNQYIKSLQNADIVFDITGGDSFSDIYGFFRLFLGFLKKWLTVLYKKPLVFLPQTYGPFKKAVSKSIARYILKRSQKIYSRDREGAIYLQNLLPKKHNAKIQLMPDLAFLLDPAAPQMSDEQKNLNHFINTKNSIIGLNISGLLFNGGYTGKNMFNLSVDYKKMLTSIIHHFLKMKNTRIILIPHVFPPKNFIIESDFLASREIFKSIKEKNRVFLLQNEYNHKEIKYIIGKCDFFLGSRMHSCIGALSQSIPTLGLSYSKKFHGVFETIGMEDCVINLGDNTIPKIIDTISRIYAERKSISTKLESTITKTKKKIINLFDLL